MHASRGLAPVGREGVVAQQPLLDVHLAADRNATGEPHLAGAGLGDGAPGNGERIEEGLKEYS